MAQDTWPHEIFFTNVETIYDPNKYVCVYFPLTMDIMYIFSCTFCSNFLCWDMHVFLSVANDVSSYLNVYEENSQVSYIIVSYHILYLGH